MSGMSEKKRSAPKPKPPASDAPAKDRKAAPAKAPAAAKAAARNPAARTSPPPAVPKAGGSTAATPKAASPKAGGPKAAAPKTAASKPSAPKIAAVKRPAAAAVSAVAAASASTAPLHVVMVASEAHPFAHTGGLAEVMAALSDALGKLGHRVTLVLPRYRSVAAEDTPVERCTLTFGHQEVAVSFHTGRERGGVTPVFVDSPGLFDRDGLYGDGHGDFQDNAWRFAVFSRAALEYLRLRGERPSIIHAHDWQAGLVPVFQKMQLSHDPIVGRVPVIFTIHNLAFQGVFPPTTLPAVGLGWEVMDVQALEYWGQISYLKGGINFSERITTVSPAYAHEILTPQLGFGLDGTLQRRAADLRGILNAIDVSRWNPAQDDLIGTSFSAADLTGKARAKEQLLQAVGLPVDAAARRRPVIGLISRLTHQKGFDVLAAALDELMELDATWVLLGSGDHEYEEAWRALAVRHAARVSTTIGYDERLAHQIEAGADIFLMPSRYEPCGLNQFYSLRYGTVPIVHATGGLRDTVRDVGEPGPNGLKFSDFSPAGLVAAVRRALDLFHKPSEWKQLQLAGMKDDHSWDVSAREYVKVYEEAAFELSPEAP